MGTATQNPGGPLLGTNIPPGMSYNAGTGAWTFIGRLLVTDATNSTSVTTGCAVFSGGIGVAGDINVRDIFVRGSSYVVGTSSSTYQYIQANAGFERGISIRTVSSLRWQIFSDAVAESGANAGSGLQVRALDDSGVTIDIPISIARASGGTISLGGSTRRSLATTGGRVRAFDVVTDTVNLNATHNVVVCNKGTAMTVNLPAVASNAGREYIIKNKGAGVVTVDANASELIDSATTQTLNQWQSTHIVCDGTIWVIV